MCSLRPALVLLCNPALLLDGFGGGEAVLPDSQPSSENTQVGFALSLATGRREQFTIVPQNSCFLTCLAFLSKYCVWLINLSAVRAWLVNSFFPYTAISSLKEETDLQRFCCSAIQFVKAILFKTKFKLVSTFWIRCWDFQDTVGLHYFV